MAHPALVVNMLLPIVAGISYMDGLRQQKKIRDVIEEADKTKIEKSKIGYKK